MSEDAIWDVLRMSEDVIVDDAVDPVVAVAVVAVVEDRSIVAVIDEASCRCICQRTR